MVMYVCIIVSVLPLSTILYWILKLYRQCGIFVYHFIRERVLHKKFIFSAGNEFSAVQDNLPMLNLEHFQFLLFDIPNA